MDSEDDMLDTHLETEEDDFYGTDDYNDSDENDNDEPEYGLEEAVDDSGMIASKRNYVVLKEEDIHRHQKDDIVGVSMVLSISEVEASILLLHYHWSVSKVHEEWFADEERVRRVVGILEGPVVPTPDAGELTCGICFESFPPENIVSVSCGHPFCPTCWTDYISTTINNGPECLMLKCPNPTCTAALGQDMIEKLAPEDEKNKFDRYFLRSYIEDNIKLKWCPAPRCDNAIDFSAGTGSYDVTCLCLHSFCWNCTEETHHPVDCDTVAQWILKNRAESENMNRVCFNEWKDHGESNGGFNACSRYEAANQEGPYDETESWSEMAKKSLEKYNYYYERWASNQLSSRKAMSDLQTLQSGKLEKLSEIQCTPESQLEFITEAWLQIIECRRVLKWTYAYGYYLPDDPDDHSKQLFFEYLLGEAESGLEKLHKFAEKELYVFLYVDGRSEDFSNYKIKLTGLTSITKTYFENLVKALENGLADVDSTKSKSSKTEGSEKGEGSSRNGGSSKNPDDN